MCKVSSSVQFLTRSVGTREGSARAQWVPNTDVYATDNGLVVKVELAGMRSEHLEITVEASRLRITGTRPMAAVLPNAAFWRWNINYGPFESVLELPPGYDLTPGQSGLSERFLAQSTCRWHSAAVEEHQGADAAEGNSSLL